MVETSPKLNISSFVIDCEAVICDSLRKPDFGKLDSHCFDAEAAA